MYRYSGKIWTAFAGEIVGTGILGGMLCYPIALFLMGNRQAAVFTYVIPFLISTTGGCIMAAMLMSILYKTGAFRYLKGIVEDTRGLQKG